MDTARYWVAVMVVAALPPGLLWWFMVHPFVGFWRSLGPRLAISVVGGSMLALAALLFQLRWWLLGPDLGRSWPLVGLAATLMALAMALFMARKRHLTNRILSGIPEFEGSAAVLLTEGPYAHIRHPRYMEVTLGVFAYAAFANHVGSWVTAFLTPPVLHLVVLLEERELAQRFGAAYEEYRARVPRYLPRRKGPVTPPGR